MTIQSQPTQTTSIHPATEIGLLSLTIADLPRSLAFYTEALGFEVLSQDVSGATLGAAGKPLLLLTEDTGASPWPNDRYGYTGLYHFAVLMPSRADLGRWLRHWLDLGFPLPGQGDHLVSEALYLSDPDGNGIEIYQDRPRDAWVRVNGQVQMASNPVDIRGLLSEGDRTGQSWTGLPSGTKLGHMHLQVGNIDGAEAFYHGVLGFDIIFHMPSALFISAGGYHHHIGMNIWHSKDAPAAPAGTAGLRFFTIVLPSEEARQDVISRIEEAGLPHKRSGDTIALQDPWKNTILLVVGSTADSAAASTLTTAFAEAGSR
jgi:catechol 2,3-dioxygenase